MRNKKIGRYEVMNIPDKTKDTIQTIQRLMAVIQIIVVFSVITLMAPDIHMILPNAEVTIPFATVNVLYSDFLLFTPMLLIVLSIYQHIYVGALMRDENYLQHRANYGAIFTLDTFAAKLMSAFFLYWMLPLCLFFFAWKGMPRTEGYILMELFCLTTFLLLAVQVKRHLKNMFFRFIMALVVIGTVGPFTYIQMNGMKNAKGMKPLITRGFNLEKAEIEGIDMRGINFKNANFKEAKITNSKLNGANLSGADLSYARIVNSKLEAVNFTAATLFRSELEETDASHANFTHTNMIFSKSTGSNFTYADFTGAKLNDAVFENSILEHAFLENAFKENTVGLPEVPVIEETSIDISETALEAEPQ